MKPIHILGISAYYHDSAAALLTDGCLVAAAQEERFSRKRHDAGFPQHAVRFCLERAGISLNDVQHIVFYDKPLAKFDRLIQTYLAYAPRGLSSFLTAMPVWMKEKLFLKSLLKKELARIGEYSKPILFTEHHQSHAASAFFPSPFEKAGILCLDGVGEWATTSVWLGEKNRMTPQWEIEFPHSIGLLYSAFTYYTGFKVNSGEYKVMGLAPYGEPRYVQKIYDHLVDLKADGTFRLNLEYFNYTTALKMTHSRFDTLFGDEPRSPESPLEQRHMDLARSIQDVTEEVVLRLSRTVHRELGVENLCLAGGVALNCVANGRLKNEGPFKNLWIQPAAGDAGGAVGAAFSIWHEYLNMPRQPSEPDGVLGAYLGPSYSDEEAKTVLDPLGAKYVELDDAALYTRIADLLAAEKVVGWFQGRMEFGPRALGARSILADARSEKMQSVLNLKIKYRESFRPFAPCVLAERVSDYFDFKGASPYMLLVAPVKKTLRIAMSAEQSGFFGIKKLNVPRSSIPAVTHVDFSARVQTVHRETNPRLHQLLEAFEAKTGCAVLVNTSFNVRGEPIVCSPRDAYRCFMRTEMDCLVLGNLVFVKQDQPLRDSSEDEGWREKFELD